MQIYGDGMEGMKDNTRKRLLVGFLCLIMTLVSIALTGYDQTERKYEKAQKQLSKGEYESAEKLFRDVQGYKDSNYYIMYTRALECGERGDYETAIETFTNLSGFRDSDQQVVYYEGRAYQDADDFASLEKARAIYEGIVFSGIALRGLQKSIMRWMHAIERQFNLEMKGSIMKR